MEGFLNKKQGEKRAIAGKVDAQGTGEHWLSFSSSRTDSGSLPAHKEGNTHRDRLVSLCTAYLRDAAAPDKRTESSSGKNHSKKKATYLAKVSNAQATASNKRALRLKKYKINK